MPDFSLHFWRLTFLHIVPPCHCRWSPLYLAADRCVCVCVHTWLSIHVCTNPWQATFILRAFLLVRTFLVDLHNFTIKFSGEGLSWVKHMMIGFRLRLYIRMENEWKVMEVLTNPALPACVCIWGRSLAIQLCTARSGYVTVLFMLFFIINKWKGSIMWRNITLALHAILYVLYEFVKHLCLVCC